MLLVKNILLIVFSEKNVREKKFDHNDAMSLCIMRALFVCVFLLLLLLFFSCVLI